MEERIVSRAMPPSATTMQLPGATMSSSDKTSSMKTASLRSHLQRIATVLDGGVGNIGETKKVPGKQHAVVQAPPGWGGGPRNRPVLSARPITSNKKVTPLDDIFTPSAPQKPIFGGQAIDAVTAKALRLAVTGTATHPLSKGWRKMGLTFRPETSQVPWGLMAQKNGSHGLIICIQAYVLRHLVFKYDRKDDIYAKNVLQPSVHERSQALVEALAGILWRAASGGKAIVCLPHDSTGFESIQGYNPDGFTEKIRLFEFTQYEELARFIKRYLVYFESSDNAGCLLFLYSVALSRSLQKIQADLDDPKAALLSDNEEFSQAGANLILCGRATPHLHNGYLVYDEDGEMLDHTLRGIPHRSDVGFLFWDKDEEDDRRTSVGSMLRTPKKPIWVTKVNKQYGLLICCNPELVGNWRSEHLFTLHYYSGLPAATKDVKLTVDTRYGRSALRIRSGRRRKEEEKKIPSLEWCIMSKWSGCTVDWNGIYPFI